MSDVYAQAAGIEPISPGHFDLTINKIKVMTMKVSKGLEFPVVALPGVGHMRAVGEDEMEGGCVGVLCGGD